MAFTLNPCACGGTSFHYLPGVTVHHGDTAASSWRWSVNMVVCQKCGRTEMFTQNAEVIATHLKGAQVIPAGQY
jgi:hypothetical protein